MQRASRTHPTSLPSTRSSRIQEIGVNSRCPLHSLLDTGSACDLSPTSLPNSPTNPDSTDRAASRFLTFFRLAILLGVAALLRASCSRGELWLDEIWTWEISHKLTWPGGLFYQLQEENNHYLNTLMVWCLRDHTGMWYRLPAISCGIAAVGMAWRLGLADSKFGTSTGRGGNLQLAVLCPLSPPHPDPLPPSGVGSESHIECGGEGAVTASDRQSANTLTSWLAGGLTATSYLMVHYSSEARGYAYAVFFAALAFHQLLVLEACQSWEGDLTLRVSRLRRSSSWLFPLACCAGFLSQPIFLTCFGAMAVWVYLRLTRQGPAEQVWPTLLRYFFPPGLFFVLLYMVDLRHAVNAGGDQYPLWQVVMETLSLTGGGPFAGWGAVVVAGLVAGAFVHGLRVLARESDDRWVFYMLVVVVMPLGLLVVLRRAEVYPRYFLIAVFFLIQAAAVGLADLLRRGAVAWVLVAVCLAAAMWGNGQHIGRLAEFGRGGYLPILESIPFQEPSPVIRLRSDHDFRHPLMLKYNLPLAEMLGKTVEYIKLDQVPPKGTDWLLTHSLDVAWQPPLTRRVQGITYDRRVFRPYAGLSGWGMALYRRRETDPTARQNLPLDP